MERDNRTQLEDAIFELRQVADNLTLVRLGIVEGAIVDNKIIDNGIYLLENNLEAIESKLAAIADTMDYSK